MDRNLLDIDVQPRSAVTCVNGLCGRDAGTCKSCRLPAATLISGHCTSCLKPCDLSDQSCPVPADDTEAAGK
jgi:hypothetical protein